MSITELPPVEMPVFIQEASAKIVSELEPVHRECAANALSQSWSVGGQGVIVKTDSPFQYHAQWIPRVAPGRPKMWLGSVIVAIAASRAVALE